MLQCLNGLCHVILDILTPYGEKILFLDFFSSARKLKADKIRYQQGA